MNLQNRTEAVPIRIKKPAAELTRMFQDYKEKTLTSFNPNVRQCQQIAYDVFQKKLYEALEEDPGAEKVFRDFNALLSHAADKWYFIKNYLKDQKAEEKDFRNTYTPEVWGTFSKAVQNRHLTGAEMDLRERRETVKDVDRVFAAQDKITAGFDDDKFLEFHDIAESTANFALDKIETHILPDPTLNPAKLMKPSEIVKYLIRSSKGFIADYDKTNIGRALDRQGFRMDDSRTRYYVELVTQPE